MDGKNAKPEKSFLVKAGIKLGQPPTYDGERNLEKFEGWVASLLQYMRMYNLLSDQVQDLQKQFVGTCLTGDAQEWFHCNVEHYEQEILDWDLKSIFIGLQKRFMPTLSLNKAVYKFDTLKQGTMTVQALHQELSKIAC